MNSEGYNAVLQNMHIPFLVWNGPLINVIESPITLLFYIILPGFGAAPLPSLFEIMALMHHWHMPDSSFYM